MKAIRKDGLRVSGVMTIECRPGTFTDTSDLPLQDLVILTVKSYQTREALKSITPIRAEDTPVVCIQNGLWGVELMANQYGQNGLVGLTSLGATYLGPGRIRFAGKGETVFGSYSDPTEHVERIAALFDSVGFPSRVTEDIASEVWMKAIVNAAINPITALTRSKNGCLMVPGLNELARAITDEAVSVAHSYGIDLPCDEPFSKVMEVVRKTSSNESSMLQQVKRGEKTEIEEITGEIVRRGREEGLDMVLNETLLDLVRCLDGGRRYV